MFHTAPESIWCSEVAVCCDALAGWLLVWRKQAAALPWNMDEETCGDSIERCDLIFPSNRVMPPALSGSNQPWSIKHSKTARTKTWEVLCT